MYVDDILVLLHKATDVIKEITEFYRAKEGSIKPPDIYLGANIMKVQMPDGREVWDSSSREYVKNAVITVNQLFEEDGEGYTLRNTVKAPFLLGYKPDIDVTEKLGPELESRYLQLIGICRWAVEIGVNLTLSANHPVHPCAPAKGSAHAYTQNCARIHR